MTRTRGDRSLSRDALLRNIEIPHGHIPITSKMSLPVSTVSSIMCYVYTERE